MAAYAALVSLTHIIDDLHRHPRPPISLHKKQVASLTAKLDFLQEFLESYNPLLSYNTEADPLEIEIEDAANAAEDAIESHVVDRSTYVGKIISSNALYRTLRSTYVGQIISSNALYRTLKKVINDMASIEKKVMKIQVRKSTPPTSSSSSSFSIVQKKRSMMVGADGALLEMKDKLTSHSRDLQIIPIVGMGGSGKTTLAINIYHDGLIVEHFHIHAWVTISQEYSIRQILIQLLTQLIREPNQGLGDEELGEVFYKHLYGRKYLIIMDDMWSIDAWDRVRNFFPDSKNGSRVVVTTRLSNLASELSSSSSLEMELLDEANSWDLLSKTVFGGESCPLEFEEIGKKIGKSCKGLPLSIVVVGRLLAKSKHTREFWEYIEENLNSIVNSEDDERCLKILHMSYKQLPVHLKPCFLYMGVFPEDEVIQTSELIRIWVAEGFLKAASGKSLEEVARVCLESLIDRNLVLVHAKGCTGNIKYCRMHDLLRDMCLREAEKERFYFVPTSQGIVETLTPIRQGIADAAQRRIVISNTISKNEAVEVVSSTPSARSLIWYHEEPIQQRLNSRLLRVLHTSKPFDEGREGSGEFSASVNQFVNSRMLVLWSLPWSYNMLWNLQTLCVGNSFYNITIAPTYIWHMPHIRHVRFINGLHLPDPPNSQDGDIVWENLQTLKTINNFRCSKRVVKIIRNIRKLALVFYERLDGNRYCLANLDCLDKLESLSCSFHVQMNPIGLDSLPSLINFPHSLKKLTLFINEFPCSEEILEKIGVLLYLEKLRLSASAFKEGEWITTQGRFPSLKYLHLTRCIGLKVWTTESSHFPCLEHLRLDWIDEMEIPLDFAEIATLRLIELNYCEASVLSSAKRILDEQEQLYGEEETSLQIQVMVYKKEKEHDSLASLNFRFTYFQI